MVSKLSREGSYRKGLEVFEALPAVGLVRLHASSDYAPPWSPPSMFAEIFYASWAASYE